MLLKTVRSLIVATLLFSAVASSETEQSSPLDRGFQLLYNLDFEGAQTDFARFQQAHPRDPLGPASEAAAYVFSELNRLGVLEARLFTNDTAFRNRARLRPDPDLYIKLNNALIRTDSLAANRLAIDANNRDALLARTLSAGLRADYSSLIEDHNLAALRFAHEATQSARQLLAVCPDCYDAYVATGISEYLIGSMSPPARWIMRLGGYSGNKSEGIQHLQLAADHGHYLAPFARILLAIAYVRDKKNEDARQVLTQLRTEFPRNPLFPRELARLDQR